MSITLGQALDKIQADPPLAEKFKNNPTSTLSDLGVDVKNLKVSQLKPETDQNAFCISVGCIVCASIG